MTEQTPLTDEKARIVVTPGRLKELWFLPQATGMVHDHQANQKVIRMEDGTEYACALDDPEAYR